jgi:hypothetical protein
MSVIEKMAKTTNDHDKSQEIRHVRLKRDIDPLSSIFDKESKANLINAFCRHSYPSANKRTIDTSQDNAWPPTKQRTINHEQNIHAVLDPGNKILDKGEGKNDTRAHFIETTPDATSMLPKPDQTNADETTGLLPGLAAPKLQVTGKPVKGNDRRRHRKENKQKQPLQQTIQRNETYWTMHKGEVQLTKVTTDRP